MDDRKIETNEALERAVQEVFDTTAPLRDSARLARLSGHAERIGSVRRGSLFTLPRLAVAMLTLVALVVAINAVTSNAPGSEDVVETALVAPNLHPSAPHSGDYEALEDDEELAHDTYLDVGFDGEESDLSLLDSPVEGLDEQELITVYDSLLNRGG